jgi:uncharacterized Fe-S center protein
MHRHNAEDHLNNIRANIPGFRTEEAAVAIAEEIVQHTTAAAKAKGQELQTIAVSKDHVSAVMKGQNVFISQIVKIILAVLDYEAKTGLEIDDPEGRKELGLPENEKP